SKNLSVPADHAGHVSLSLYPNLSKNRRNKPSIFESPKLGLGDDQQSVDASEFARAKASVACGSAALVL
ncbi:hypothetical protein, partial [Rhizobium sp. RU20A]|uniref:hypothetical protein n=1 Tax=Rhizobium sp. RU20A TaxID=1907412 RepID=UPI001AED34E2